MKRRRALLFSLTVVLALSAACGWWLHVQQRQYVLNRQLIVAMVHDDVKQALVLVNEGADPNTRELTTPAPSLKLLFKQLLYHKPPVTNSNTAFMLACGAPPYMRQMLQEDLSKPPGSVPENLALLQAMLAHGAEVHARTFDNQTALHFAAETGRWQTAEMLIQQGLDVNAQDGNKQTPLMYAASSDTLRVMRLLMAHGANPNAQDTQGRAVLFYAIISRDPKSAIPELLAHGAASNLPGSNGLTPIQLAQKERRPDLVRLLQRGAK